MNEHYGVSGESWVPHIFVPEGRTYSPPAKRAVVTIPLVGPCALRGDCGVCGRLFRQCRPANRQGEHCLCSWTLDGSQECDPSAHIGMMLMPANCMGKPATGSFAGMWHLRMPFLFCERETETVCGPERRMKNLWQFTITK